MHKSSFSQGVFYDKNLYYDYDNSDNSYYRKKMGGHSTTHINDNLSDIEIIIIMKIPVQAFFCFLFLSLGTCRGSFLLCHFATLSLCHSVTLSLCHLSLNFKLATLNFELLFSSASVPLCLCAFVTLSLISSSRFAPRTLLSRVFLPQDRERSE